MMVDLLTFEPVASRSLPVLTYEQVVRRAVATATRPRRSPVTVKGYRKGQAPANKGKTYPPDVLTPAEIQRLLDACAGNGKTRVRLHAHIVALWRGGLRIQESLDLLPKDIDLESGTITSLHGKGDKRRVIGIDKRACAELARWMQLRAKLGARREDPVFCVVEKGKVGRPLTQAAVRDALRCLRERAGVERRCNPHGFRHRHAFELANEGVPVHHIKQQLGHSSLATTDRYISHLNPAAVVQVMNARTWEPEHVQS
jgi:site-specific recombinase XerD